MEKQLFSLPSVEDYTVNSTDQLRQTLGHTFAVGPLGESLLGPLTTQRCEQG